MPKPRSVRHPEVANLVSDFLDNAGYGGLTAMGRAVGVSTTTVQRWHRLEASPEEEYWPAIEDHIDQPRGTLRATAGMIGTAPPGSIPDRLEAVEAELTALRELVGEIALRLPPPKASRRS